MSSKCMEYPTKNQLYEFFVEFGATEESVRNDVQYIKEWLRKQPHLPNIEDDEWLSNFLLKCKNSLEKMKKRLDSYFTIKTLMPDIFQDRDQCLNQMAEIIKQGCTVPSLKVTPDGYRILFVQAFDDPEKIAFNFHGMIKLTLMLIEYGVKRDFNRGLIAVYNLRNARKNAILFWISNMKKTFTLYHNIAPHHVHKFYIINYIPALEPSFRIWKSFLNKKLIDRLELWKDDPKHLNRVLPKEMLPTEYGGNAGSLEEMRDIFYTELKTYRDWFVSEEQYKADLSKRPADHSYNHDILTDYGVDGSFRKICLD